MSYTSLAIGIDVHRRVYTYIYIYIYTHIYVYTPIPIPIPIHMRIPMHMPMNGDGTFWRVANHLHLKSFKPVLARDHVYMLYDSMCYVRMIY